MARRKHKRPHNTGSIRIRDGRVQIQWTKKDGSRGTKTVALDEITTFLARANAGLEDGEAGPAAPTGRLADMAETWLAGRADMASNYDDRNRWKNHLLPLVGQIAPDQVDVPMLKRWIVTLREKGLSKGTVRLCMALVSSLYGDLVEDGSAKLNPVRMLSRKTRRNDLKSDWDWKMTPFVRSPTDIRRIYSTLYTLDPYVGRAYLIGACAGLRTSEVRALRWEHVDLERRTIHVREQVKRRGVGVKVLKDKESRIVPISDSLYENMVQWQPQPAGLVCSASEAFLNDHRMGEFVAAVPQSLQKMTWYQATRHTFASQWVLNGGTLEKLCEMMGHSSVTVTERYAHLIPGNYTDADRARVEVPVSCFVPAVVN